MRAISSILVEQATINHLVAGSSPPWPTKRDKIDNLHFKGYVDAVAESPRDTLREVRGAASTDLGEASAAPARSGRRLPEISAFRIQRRSLVRFLAVVEGPVDTSHEAVGSPPRRSGRTGGVMETTDV